MSLEITKLKSKVASFFKSFSFFLLVFVFILVHVNQTVAKHTDLVLEIIRAVGSGEVAVQRTACGVLWSLAIQPSKKERKKETMKKREKERERERLAHGRKKN